MVECGRSISLRSGIGAGEVLLATVGGVRGRWELLVAGDPLVQVSVAEQSWLWQGLYEWLSGHPRKAHQAWRKSLAAAQRLAIPYEQTLVYYEPGRHAAEPERTTYLAQACRIFAHVGATYDVLNAQGNCI